MKKAKLSKLLTLGFLVSSVVANAQLHPPTFYDANTPNFYKDYVGVQLTVTEPSGIAGPKVYTTPNDWGGQVTTSIVDKDLVKAANDSLACTTPISNSMAGKVAFIFRGDCEFGAKALAAENAGAIAVIIVNNIPGGPVGMGAGAVGASVTIPVFMISQDDGNIINQQLNAGQTVKVSFTSWGSGKTNDLAVLHNGLALWHNYLTPLNQVVANNGNPVAYKGYDGAFIANFGTATETSVQLKAVTTFTPEGSTVAQNVRRDSVTFNSFPASDSIVAIGMASTYDVHATQKGRFDVTYSLSSATTDEFPANNTASYSYYIGDNTFSKSRWDFTKNEPVANVYYRLGSGDPFIAGNLYYVANGGYAALNSKVSLSKDGDTTLDAVLLDMLLFKWDDTLIADSLLEIGELTLVGVGSRDFTAADPGGDFYEISYQAVDASGIPTGGPVALQGNSWYFVAAAVPTDVFLGMDGIINYYPRTYLRKYAVADSVADFYSSIYIGDRATFDNDFVTTPNLVNGMFLFERGGVTTNEVIDSARFAQQKNGVVPSISLTISPWTLDVKTPVSSISEFKLFPNPVVANSINVSLKLDKVANRITYSVMDLMGRVVKRVVHNNVQNEEFTISTDGMVPGNYLMVINADNSVTNRKFVVAK